MKKIMMILAVVVLLLGASGQAMAAFVDGDLIRVVYNGLGTGTEYATDLGNFSTLTSNSLGNVVLNTDNFNLSSVGAPDQAYVAYYMVTSTPGFAGNYVWTSGPTSSQTGGGRNMFSNFLGGVHSVDGAYNVAAAGASATTLLQSDANSYWTIMNTAGAGQGQMRGFIPAGNADQNLAALSTTGYVDQYLYYYATPNTASSGLQVATLRTFADGHTELNPSATPIPATFLLFGSGLLGLVGIRRKQAA